MLFLVSLLACTELEGTGRSPNPREDRPDLRPEDTAEPTDTTPAAEEQGDTSPPEETGTTGGTDPDPDPSDEGPCSFPQGVPDKGWIASASSYDDTDPTVDDDVNEVMVALSGCGVSSDCDITGFAGNSVDEVCQSWFAAVTEELRARGYCAGLHTVGSTDEIAVSNTGCDGRWYGYHICYYGGPKVVWNPGARRGWWQIDSTFCP